MRLIFEPEVVTFFRGARCRSVECRFPSPSRIESPVNSLGLFAVPFTHYLLPIAFCLSSASSEVCLSGACYRRRLFELSGCWELNLSTTKQLSARLLFRQTASRINSSCFEPSSFCGRQTNLSPSFQAQRLPPSLSRRRIKWALEWAFSERTRATCRIKQSQVEVEVKFK